MEGTSEEELQELSLERELLTGSPHSHGLAGEKARGQRRPWLLLGCLAPTAPGKIYAKRLSLQSKVGWRGGKRGALGWLPAGSEEGSVIHLLFDVLDGDRQLRTRGLVGHGHVQVLFLHTHGDD